VRVAFDAVMLSVYLHPGAKYPKPIDRIPERIQALVDELQAAGSTIVLPTPVLSEFLVLAGSDGSTYLSELTTTAVFDIQPFDIRAAVEAAAAQRKALDDGDKKSGTTARWQVVKVDRQFVAVAMVHGVSVVYSDDDGVKRLAEEAGMQVKGVGDLPVPPPETASLFPAP
jgi:predicted nucleic acid-binding protein